MHILYKIVIKNYKYSFSKLNRITTNAINSFTFVSNFGYFG